MRGTIYEQRESLAVTQCCNNSMGHRNILPPFDVAVGRLAGFSCQDDTTVSLSNYQGRVVQTLNSPCYAFFSQSNADQNSVHPVNPLNQFSVASLTQASLDSVDESDLTVISGSIRGKYVTCNPDKESVAEQFPIPGNSLCSQSHLSESEPALSEQTPSNRLNLNHHLTNLPAELAYPQYSRPAVAVNPLNLQQANSDNPVNSTIIVADKSSQAERRRARRRERERKRYQDDPVFAECRRKRKRERYQNDAAFAERQRQRQKQYQKHRRQNDPAFLERLKEKLRKRCQNDPFFANGRRIYKNTYSKMRRKTSREEASKLASVAREEYFRSVKSSEGSGNLHLGICGPTAPEDVGSNERSSTS